MTLLDTSAWIEYMRKTGSDVALHVRALIESRAELLTAGPIVMELLAGASGPVDATRIQRIIAGCRRLPVAGDRDWEDAAAIYATCRRAGVTPRQVIDCLIASIAIRNDVPVLSLDRDLDLIAEHTALKLAL